VNKLGTQHF